MQPVQYTPVSPALHGHRALAAAGEAGTLATLVSRYPQLPLVGAAVKLRLGCFAAAIASLGAPLSLESGGMDHAAGACAASSVLQEGAAAARNAQRTAGE